jgi:hypothetical protein
MKRLQNFVMTRNEKELAIAQERWKMQTLTKKKHLKTTWQML